MDSEERTKVCHCDMKTIVDHVDGVLTCMRCGKPKWDFSETDEPVEAVVEAFRAGTKRITGDSPEVSRG